MKKFTRKIIFLMSMALLFVTIPFALTACDFGGKHEHSFGAWQEGFPATCYSSGQRGYYFCTRCGKMFDADKTTEIYNTYIPMAEHTLEYRPAEPATCSDAGHEEYWECTECKCMFKDEYGYEETSEWGIRIDPTREHDLVKAHDYVAPTCTTAGTIEYWKCNNCHNWFYEDNPDTQIGNKNAVIIPAQHKTTRHDQISARCTMDGTIKYWECDDCGKKFSDYECTKEITSDDDLVIPATGHSTKYVEAKENTHNKSGCIEHWECTKCSGTFADKEATTSISATIPAGHCFGANGLCKYCEQEEYSAGLTFELLKDSDTYRVHCEKFTQGDLVIPTQYTTTSVGAAAKNVTHIAKASNNTGITSVTIPKTITTIEADAFKNCTGLTAVYYKGTLEDWVKISFGSIYSNPLYYAKNLYLLDEETGEYNLLTTATLSGDNAIGDYAFAGCTSLTSITINNNPSIGTSVLADCTKLESITLPFYTPAYLFGETTPSSLKTINYTQTRGITKLNSNTFSSQYGTVENITIPDGITIIDYDTFKYFTNLKTIMLPNTITELYRSFSNCTNLQYNRYDNGLYLGTESNQYAYLIKATSTGITSLTIYTDCLAVSSCALEGCSSLKSINLPNSVKSIGEYAFKNCTALASITIPNSVTSIGTYAFYNCSGLESVTISNSVTSIGESTFEDCRNLTSINIPNSVTNIAKAAFSDCTSLTSITIPTSVTNIESGAFEYCRALTIYCEAESQPTEWGSDWNATSSLEPYCPVVWNCNSNDVATDENIYTVVNGIRYAIKNGTATLARQPSNLTDVVLPSSISYKGSTYNVTSIDSYAFSSCTALTSIIIGDNVTSIGTYAFYNCTALTNITIGNNVTSIGAWAFSDCTALTTITISSSVKSIDSKAFDDCTALARVNYLGTIDQWTQIRFTEANPLPYAKEGLFINDTLVTELNFTTATTILNFENYDKLTSVTMGDSVTRIGAYAFSGCTALSNITIGDNVTSIGSYAFKNCTALPSITISSSITSVESYAFENCTALTRVNYLGTIDQWAQINFKTTPANPLYYATEGLFINDQLVTEINLTTATTIGSYVFANYHKLTSVTIGNSVTSISEFAFYNCTLSSITIGDNVTSIGSYAFEYCTALASITIPNSVTSIGNYAFSGCTALNTVTIGSGVTRVKERAFYYCPALKRVNYSGTINQWARISFNDGSSNPLSYATEGLFINDKLVTTANLTTTTTIGSSAFIGYNKLTSVTIGNSVTSIGEYAFSGCNALTSVTIPTSVRYIDKYAFNCQALTIYCKEKSQPVGWKTNWDGSGVVVWNCDSNDVADNGYIYTVIDGIHYRLKNSTAYVTSQPITITSADIPSTISYNDSTYNVTSIGGDAFENCTALTSVTIPSSVTSIGSDAFYGCTALTKVNYNGTIDQWAQITFGNGSSNPLSYATEGLFINDNLVTTANLTTTTTIGNYAFKNHKKLTSVTIGNSITSIGTSAFSGCTALTSITIPSSVTSIGNYAFSGCTALTSVTIPSSVTSIGIYAFSGCTALTSITIPSSVTSIGQWAFSSCYALTIYCEEKSQPAGWKTDWSGSGVVVWDCNNNDVATDGYIYTVINGIRYMLKDSEASAARQPKTITSAVIPSTISYNGSTYNVTSIGYAAFSGFTALTNVTIPNSVTSIGTHAFSGCTALSSITIPNSVTSIEYAAFSGCTALTNITIGNNVTSIGEYAFKNCTALSSITIPSSVTRIRSNAFENCTALAKVNYLGTIDQWAQIVFWNISSNPLYYATEGLFINDQLVTTANLTTTTIGSYAFINHKKLTSVTIGNSVTSIGTSAFSGCTALSSITIPSSVTRIENYAFKNCTALTINCEATSKPSGWYTDWNNSDCTVVWGYTAD